LFDPTGTVVVPKFPGEFTVKLGVEVAATKLESKFRETFAALIGHPEIV